MKKIEISYSGKYPILSLRDQTNADQLNELIRTNSKAFSRDPNVDHVTGSAFVVNADKTKVLLTHHMKLNTWLQLGGHCDDVPNPLQVAMREAHEESGLADIKPISSDVFDIDIHEIPVIGDQPAHLHYDVRYLLQADDTLPLTITGESKDLRWVQIEEMDQLTNKDSVLILREKLQYD